MKMSLKDWFLHEENHRSSSKHSSVGQKSSSNVQINIEEAGPERPDEDQEMTFEEFAQYLTQHGVDPAEIDTFQRNSEWGTRGVPLHFSEWEDEWVYAGPYAQHRALGQMEKSEGLAEYEDPTSNGHDSDDDSAWAGPKSSREGMPHLRPQNLAQQRGADGWDEMHKSSNSHYPESGTDLKAFFGDEPYPKGSEVDEAGGEQMFGEPGVPGEEELYRTYADWHKGSQPSSHEEAEQWWQDTRSGKGDPLHRQSYFGSDEESSGFDEDEYEHRDIDRDRLGQDEPEIAEAGEKDLPDEMPMDWMDQPLDAGPSAPQHSSKQAVPWRAAKRASNQAKEPTVRKPAAEPEGEMDFGSLDDPDFLSKMGIDPDEPPKRSGTPKMADTIKTKGGDDEEGEGDVSQKYDYSKGRRERLLSPKLKPEFDPDDEEAQELRGEPLGAEEAEEGELSWDELRATEPEAAQELEREVPEGEREGLKFKRKADGRIYLDSPTGRKAFLGPELGWSEMDDGESPSGEF